MYLYREKNVTKNSYGIKYSLYVADVAFRDFINSFRNVGGAQTNAANISFQEELFNLEQSGKAMSNRTHIFEPPHTVRCQYDHRKVTIHDYENREPIKTSCVDYCLLTHISEIKHNFGIDAGIVPKISGFTMQKHDDEHKL
jgi:hypothetical protein